MDQQTQMQVLKQGSTQEKGEDARLSTLVGAIAISDMVKTTLGPSGMDKILQSIQGGVRITNDGATILKSVVIENAAARVLIDISRVQDETAGDGTTSVCVLAGELLKQAKILLDDRVHPMTVVEGYRKSADAARTRLLEISETSSDIKADLLKIARTTMGSKVLSNCQELFAQLAVDAVLKLQGSTDLKHVQILKKAGGVLTDSYLDSGFILDKKIGQGCPKQISQAKILLANTALDQDKIKIQGSSVKVDSHQKLEDIQQAERQRMLNKCEKIISHDCNVFINRQLIYDIPTNQFAKSKILSIENAEFENIDRLSLVLDNADIVSTFDTPNAVKLGTCELVEEIMIGDDKLIRFSGLPNSKASTIVLRGASGHILDEAERSLHDALCVVSQTIDKHNRVILGAGVAETEMANAVEEASRKQSGKIALCMMSFATALRQLPAIVASNGGFDGQELQAVLRNKHFEGQKDIGLDMIKGGVCDVRKLGIYESCWMKEHVLIYASEAAEQILRVDSIINCAPRKQD
ncbi:TCP-1 chaperonin subunit beta [Spironucleus salmonicida]|uniref:CCT-beta n=1 Tax=Spironucleus salmonicida TaxID=348837 RepID=V6LCP1_9EUKA|nr:TCP-1 chaperonin subunit beta [Spironucleus salmonicida]|eukprot:EST41446.1 TCP-1 chaperonin subunit beta [Spironucleus salmonicida]